MSRRNNRNSERHLTIEETNLDIMNILDSLIMEQPEQTQQPLNIPTEALNDIYRN